MSSDDSHDSSWREMPEWCVLDHGDGPRVKLADALATLEPALWSGIVVDHPAFGGPVRPWRFCDCDPHVTRGPDGVLRF